MAESGSASGRFHGVMVSSTFTDLEQHRAALIRALSGEELLNLVMENDTARADLDLIDSSLQMVQRAAAYIGLISRKYGQTPECARRNPDKLSITELEFNEAVRLQLPILLFVMGEKHLLREADIETDAAKREKLNAFRERATRSAERIYCAFDSLDDFEKQAI